MMMAKPFCEQTGKVGILCYNYNTKIYGHFVIYVLSNYIDPDQTSKNCKQKVVNKSVPDYLVPKAHYNLRNNDDLDQFC